jgi:antirestriction protein ArdC
MKPERPKQQMEIDWQQLIDEALTLPGNTGQVYNRFYNYSFLNQLLLRMQGVAEPVATYKRWASLGRQVLRGSKAKAILRPITVKREDAEGNEEAFTRFKMVNCLFGLSETEGEALPPAEIPEWNLDQALDALGITRVPFEATNGNMQGYSIDRNIAVSPVAVYPLKTTIHEVGHVVLGHTKHEIDLFHPELMHRGVKEFQAETTSYLTMNELELMTPEQATVSRGYVQSWLGSQRPSDYAIRQVFSATDTILRAGRPPQAVGEAA